MTEYHDKLHYTGTELTKPEITARSQEMSFHVRTSLSHLRTGMRIQAETLLPRLPTDFLETSYPDGTTVMNNVVSILKAIEKEGTIIKMSGGEYMVQKKVDITPLPPVNKTRLACLHLRDVLLANGDMPEIMQTAPDALRSAYASESSLKGAFKMIVNRIVDMSDADFATFYDNLESDRKYASPFQGLGSVVGKADDGGS